MRCVRGAVQAPAGGAALLVAVGFAVVAVPLVTATTTKHQRRIDTIHGGGEYMVVRRRPRFMTVVPMPRDQMRSERARSEYMTQTVYILQHAKEHCATP